MKKLSLLAILLARAASAADTLNPASLPVVATVDSRFQSVNVEMLEVTGGRFWKPYRDIKPGTGTGAMPGPELYEYRPPIDLSNPRLRSLAAALGPMYLRVSGTWANTTFFQDSDTPAPASPPKGFNGVLTRAQWKGVLDFARATGAGIVTSFATSEGTRDDKGVWTPDQARTLLKYTKSQGGHIAAAEFWNEPNMAQMGGAPKGYDPAAYARDVEFFRKYLKSEAPEILFVGPGSAVEGGPVKIPFIGDSLSSDKLMTATGPVYDVFSYHLYAAVSQRCAAAMPAIGTSAAAALSDEWLGRIDSIHAYYQGLRDRFEPGKPIWLTETAEAACGGDLWASTFLDTFRYLEEHARLARSGVRTIMHNTLAASDYGLLDEKTFAPRPDYWAALLWNRLMGTKALDAGGRPHVFAHCMNGVPGGVTVLALNTDRAAARTIRIASDAERFTLTAADPEGGRADLNGTELKLGPGDALPRIAGVKVKAGDVTLPPVSVTFLTVRDAGNAGCR